MQITLYGKSGCGKCDAAKDKFKRLNLPYTYEDIEKFTKPHEGWREDGSVEVMAAYQQLDTLPIIFIDSEPYTYSQAMRHVKLAL